MTRMMMVTASASHGDDIGSSRIVGLLVLVFSAQSRGQSRKGLMLMEDKRPNCSSQKRIVVVATTLITAQAQTQGEGDP